MSLNPFTLLYFLGACSLLVVSAELLMNSLLRIAQYYRLSEFVIGFMVVALATTIPELFIGINSAVAEHPTIALGNSIGSNIMDLTLVIGVITLLKGGIKVETKTVRVDTLLMFVVATAPLILLLDKELSGFDGLILLAFFVFYVWRVLSQEKKFHERLESVPKSEFILHSVIALIGLVFTYFFSIWIVNTGLMISEELSLPPILVGLFFVSLGTALPELTFETKAILSRHKYMALGDTIGNVVARSTLVLGVTALIHPIQAEYILFLTSAFFMIIVAFLFMTFVTVEKHILIQEGVALVILYVLFIIIELNIRVLESQ